MSNKKYDMGGGRVSNSLFSKETKGFTLIELLAVIVVLAIIALIAVPMIMNIIEQARKEAAISSARSYIRAAEAYVALSEIDEGKISLENINKYNVTKETTIEDKTYDAINDLIETKGSVPVGLDDYIVLGENYTVIEALLTIGGYGILIKDDEVISITKGKIIESESIMINKEIDTVEIDKTLQLEVIIEPDDTSNKIIKWTSSDESIAKVDNKGKVTGIKSGEVTITATTSNNKTDSIKIIVKGVEYSFEYKGASQEFIVLKDGIYQIELWGAGGGKDTNSGGYTKGNIRLTKDQKLYIYVGQTSDEVVVRSGKTTPATFNGGGSGGYGGTRSPYNYRSGNAGGGATDIRLKNGSWNDAIGLRSRIMVAGGGGGISYNISDATKAGGLTSYNGYSVRDGIVNRIAGANQTSGASFGIGSNGANTGVEGCCEGHAGGGGGYYGGSGGPGGYGSDDYADYGAGGSSYISGHTGAVAIISESNQSPKSGCITGTTDNSCSIHYSGYKFTDTVMLDGAGYRWTNVKGSQGKMPNPNGGYYDLGLGHAGNGYAKITYLGN